MIKILQTILVIAFLIKLTRGAFYLVYIWQLKEYRFDRFWTHITETYQGRQSFFGRANQIKLILILLFPATFVNPTLAFLYSLVVLSAFLYDARIVIREISSKTFKRPVFTLKAIFIFISAILLEIILLNILFFDIFFWVLILDRMLPIFVFLIIWFLSFPTELFWERKIVRAIEILRSNKNVIVIGVTGSYGKSSTKEFIAQILSYRFRVLKTKGTNNTPIGIANTIIAGLKKNTEIFVAEMGAYKKGEIRQICQIVKPKIGVLTGISPQHLSLFGSLQNIIDGKYELIESLPKSGLAIFNGNNIYCHDLYTKTQMRKLIYSFGENSDIKVSNIRVNRFNVNFRIKERRKTFSFSANLLGRHNVEDLLAAILIARALRMDFLEIKNAVSKISYLPMTMKPIKYQSGAVLVDDTFNESPDSTVAAIDYMKIYSGKKILVLSPMIELGREVKSAHFKVGLASRPLTKIFLTSRSFYKDLNEGAKKAGVKRKIIEVLPVEKIVAKLKALAGPGDVIVFEGRQALKVLKSFTYV